MPLVPVKFTATELPASAVTITTPVPAVASATVAPLDTPVPKVRTGCVGACVSKVNELLPATPELPAASVATAVTTTPPLPKVVRSPAVKVTAWAEPVAVRFLVTVPLVPVKVTATELPLSADTVTTPVPAVASAEVAPPDTPVPRANTGAFGETVSRVKLVVPAEPALPAASVATALTLTAPLPSDARSATDNATAWAEPVPVTVLTTLPTVPAKVKATLLPFSALTVTTPVSASRAVAPPATPVPRASTGAPGAVASTTTVCATEAALSLPARSVALAVKL